MIGYFVNSFLLQLISKLYMPTASVVWNGKSVNGLADIVTFYESLPISETTVESIDAQPILSESINIGKNPFIVDFSAIFS